MTHAGPLPDPLPNGAGKKDSSRHERSAEACAALRLDSGILSEVRIRFK